MIFMISFGRHENEAVYQRGKKNTLRVLMVVVLVVPFELCLKTRVRIVSQGSGLQSNQFLKQTKARFCFFKCTIMVSWNRMTRLHCKERTVCKNH